MTEPILGGDRFDDKVALVTGSSRNLGAAIARRFAAHGAAVAVQYQRDAGAARLIAARCAGVRAKTARHMRSKRRGRVLGNNSSTR